MQRLYIVLDVDQSFIYTPKGLEYMDANVSSLVKRHFSENRPYFPWKKQNVRGAQSKLDTDRHRGRLCRRSVCALCAEDGPRWRLRLVLAG